MGTSGAYGGAGGSAGRDISDGGSAWLDDLAGQPTSGDDADGREPVELPPRLVAGALSQLHPRSGGGGGGAGMGGGGRGTGGNSTGGGRTGGLRRSTSSVAGRASRAGAAAYAYATGDRAGLSALGLDYDSLQALGDPVEITRRIVVSACGELATGTLEDHEERYVAATVAEWVLEQAQDGDTPTPEEIARHSIAIVMAEVLSTELTREMNERPEELAAIAEDELLEAAEVLTAKADLSVEGATEAELSKAIEDGIETLRQIYGVGG